MVLFMMEKLPNTKPKSTRLNSVEIWFWYQLWYRPKILDNLGFGFGIGTKPKYVVVSVLH